MIIIIVLSVFVGIGLIRFFTVSSQAENRFKEYKNKAKAFETTYGTVNYIDEGEGEAILSVHGICTGYDQAFDTLAGKENQFRIIAPARFGYQGSDIPKDATVEKQVEVFLQLIDELEIEKTYVIGTSAGGTAAIKFALEHPERTKGLILYCSGYPALEKAEKEITVAGPPAFICNDFMMWLMSPLLKPIMGLDSSALKSIMPLGSKYNGIDFDGKVTNTVMINHYTDYDMSKLKVPVLIIHSKDDKLASFENVKPWLEKIPDCAFVPLESGGHMMDGNSEIMDKALDDFLNRTKD